MLEGIERCFLIRRKQEEETQPCRSCDSWLCCRSDAVYLGPCSSQECINERQFLILHCSLISPYIHSSRHCRQHRNGLARRGTRSYTGEGSKSARKLVQLSSELEIADPKGTRGTPSSELDRYASRLLGQQRQICAPGKRTRHV